MPYFPSLAWFGVPIVAYHGVLLLFLTLIVLAVIPLIRKYAPTTFYPALAQALLLVAGSLGAIMGFISVLVFWGQEQQAFISAVILGFGLILIGLSAVIHLLRRLVVRLEKETPEMSAK